MCTSKRLILDTVILRVMAFSHPQGIDILLKALGTQRAYFPGEVYNQDENSLDIAAPDEILSELARGIRFARRKVATAPIDKAKRYQNWLKYAKQLDIHFEQGSLIIDPLTTDDLIRRDALQKRFAIGKGEAACLVLSERYQTSLSIFLSSDEKACQGAKALGLTFLTLPEVLDFWVQQQRPTLELLNNLIYGMQAATFRLKIDLVKHLQELVAERV